MAARSYLGIGLTVALCVSACDGKVAPGLPLDADIEEWDFGDDAGPRTPVPGRDAGTGIDASRSDEADADSEPGPSEPNDPPPEPPKPDAGGKPSTPQPSASGDCSRVTDVLLCDDFESVQLGGRPDMSVWSAPFGYWPTVDGTHVARGTKALHFTRMSGEPGLIQETKSFQTQSSTTYGRMYVWFESLPTSTNAHWSVAVTMQQSSGWELRVDGQPRNGENRLGFGSVGNDDSGSWDWHTGGREDQSKVALKTWTCIEWMIKSDTSETKMWINGAEQPSLALNATEYREGDQEGGRQWTFPRFDALRIGAWTYQFDATPGETDLWIDELIIATKPIGCSL